jgi:CHAT domain-containing protein
MSVTHSARCRRWSATLPPWIAAIALITLDVCAAQDTTGAPAARVTAAWTLADAQTRAGNLIAAEQTLVEAGSVADSDSLRAGTAVRLGWTQASRGKAVEAARQLATAESLVAALSPPDRLQLRFAEGLLAVRLQDYLEAESHFESAALEARLQGAAHDDVRARVDALRARLDSQEIAALETRLAELQQAAMRLPASEETARLLGAVGELHRRAINEFRSPLGLRRDALAALDRSRAYAQSDWTRAFAIGLIGALYEDEGRLAEAQRLTQQAIFLAQAVNARDQLYRWEWQAARLERASGDLERSARLLDQAMVGLGDVRNDLLQSSRQSFARLIEPVYLDFADVNLLRAAALKSGSPEEQALLREIRSQLESLKRAEIQDYFENQCAARPNVQARDLAAAGVAIVYPVLLPTRLDVLIESGGKLRRFSTPVSRGEATAMTRRLRLALERASTGTAYLESSQSLYRWLLADAEPWLASQSINTLIFVPSGALRTIPLSALHDGRQFLIERYAIATTPAITLVGSFDKVGIDRMLVGGLTQSVQGFSGLPGVAVEVRALTALFPGQSFTDEAFQLSAIESQLSNADFSVAHLATHGEFSSDHRRSFVLTYDNRLTMDALRFALDHRNRPLDLLVLSACRTAAGDDRAALGLAGVAVQAGARSALASLWYISDDATADLMNNFYRNLKQGQGTKAQSLQQAQIALLRSEQFGHPSYWAPFLLIGSWQ